MKTAELLSGTDGAYLFHYFTKDEFIGFLKGNIIKYCLRKKGSDLQDFEKIEHYSRKLQKVLKDEN